MANSTIADSLVDLGWIVQGSVIGAANLVLVAAILRYEALRDAKEYVVLMALALGDAVNMTGNFAGGFYRLLFLHQGLLSARQCLLRPHFLLTLFSEHLSTLMLCVVAFDRLVFVISPLPYLARKISYARKMVAFAYVSVLAFGGVGFGRAMSAGGPENLLDARCIPLEFIGNMALVGRVYSIVWRASLAVNSVASVFLMLLLWPVYIGRQQKMSANIPQAFQLKRQRDFTKSIAISTCCTFFLYVVPLLMAIYSMTEGWTVLALACKFMFGFNALANVIIYQLGHGETKKAIVSMFKCKDMPAIIDMWHHSSTGTVKKSATKQNNKVAPAANRQQSRAIEI